MFIIDEILAILDDVYGIDLLIKILVLCIVLLFLFICIILNFHHREEILKYFECVNCI